MHADHAQRLIVDQELGDHGAARLERREVERRAVENADMALHQDRIAVPADVAGIELEEAIRRGLRTFSRVTRWMADTEVEPADTMPVAVDERVRGTVEARPPWRRSASWNATMSASISCKTIEHAMRIAAAVGADRFTHIVGGDGDIVQGIWSHRRQ